MESRPVLSKLAWCVASTALATVIALSGQAQEYGQWSWSANVGVGSRGLKSDVDGATAEDWRTDDLRVFAGVSGFVVHPAIAAFDIGGDISIQSETAGYDHDRSGYRGRIRILPQSGVPVELHASRASFDYGTEVSDAPVYRRGAPDSIETIGGSLRVRNGALAGLLAGVERTSTEYAGSAGSSSDKWERLFANWSGESAGVRHLILLDRRSTTYGDLEYSYDDLSMSIDERGGFGRAWKWNAVASGFKRDYAYDEGSSGSTTLLRLRGQASRRLSSERFLTIRYDAGSTAAEGAATTTTQRIFADLRTPIGREWTLSPYAGLSYISTESVNTAIPEVGFAGAWSRTFEAVSIDLSGSLGVLTMDDTLHQGDESFDIGGTEAAGSIALAISRVGSEGLSQRLDVAASRNEFASAGEAIPGLPDLGFSIGPTGFQDSARARFSVAKALNARRLSLWAEYGVRRFDRELSGEPEGLQSSRIRDLLLSVQLNMSRVQVLVNGGTTAIDATSGDQRIDYYSGSMVVRAPWGILLNGAYLHSSQDVDLAPDIELDRVDVGLEWSAGLVRLGARTFLTREQRSGGISFDSTGMEVYLGRSFGGLLPVVSAPEKRGVVK